MGFKFRKRIKILPGIHVNIGKKGITSASVGGKGLSYNVKAGKGGDKVVSRSPIVFLGVIVGTVFFFAWLISHL